MSRSALAVYSPEAGHPAAPVDLVHLARHTLGNRDLELEVLRLFVRQSRTHLERLKLEEDFGRRCEVAHTIKGSARGIGAWKVADLAERLESAAGNPVSQVALDLENAIDQANDFICTLLDKA